MQTQSAIIYHENPWFYRLEYCERQQSLIMAVGLLWRLAVSCWKTEGPHCGYDIAEGQVRRLGDVLCVDRI